MDCDEGKKTKHCASRLLNCAERAAFFLQHLVASSTSPPRTILTLTLPQKPPTSPAQNHKAALTSKPLNLERIQTLYYPTWACARPGLVHTFEDFEYISTFPIAILPK
jgi:hypothetical protein